MGNYTPDSPITLGMQWPPVAAETRVLDDSTEIGYRFRVAADTPAAYLVLRTTQPPPGNPDRKELVAAVYPAGEEAATGPARKVTAAVASGALVGGAALSGAANVQDALRNPSDGAYITFGPNDAVQLWFDTSTAGNPDLHGKLQNSRILDVSVLYVVTGPFAEVEQPMWLSLERPATAIWPMDYSITGPAEHVAATQVRRARLGELNPWWSSATSPDVTADRYPFEPVVGVSNHIGLTAWAAAGGTNINARLDTSDFDPALEFQLHYAALEITYVGQEARVAAGGLDISAGATFYDGVWQYAIPLTSMQGTAGTTPTLSAGTEYAVTVGLSAGGVMATPSTVPVPVDVLLSAEPFPSHVGVEVRKTIRAGSAHELVLTDALPSLTLYDGTPAAGTVAADSHGYVTQLITDVHILTGQEVVAVLEDDVAADYEWVVLWARRSPNTTGDLTVYHVDATLTLLGPAASITPAEFDALPEIANGWKRVIMRLDSPITSTGAGTLRLMIEAVTEEAEPWQILGADVNPTSVATGDYVALTSYGGETAYAIPQITGYTTEDLNADFSIFLVQELDTVADLAAGTAVQALSLVDEHCGQAVDAIPTGITYVTLTWTEINSEAVGGWAYYEVQRQDDTMDADEWETIAEITTPTVTAMDDYEARVGVESRYRIRMVHRTGVEGPWSAEAAVTVAAPGVTGTRVDVGVLILTSNDDPSLNVAHVHTTDRPEAEDFTYPEADELTLQRMYQRDYAVAFRPTERDGVRFSRTLLVNALGVPAETLSRGVSPLRDLAHAAVPYVCVRDELGNRWLTAVTLPASSHRRMPGAGHLVLATATFGEVTGTPAPWDTEAPCEGLRPAEGYQSALASADDPAAIATIINLDMAIEIRPSGTDWHAYMDHFDWNTFAGWELDVSDSRILLDVFNGSVFEAEVSLEGLGLVPHRRRWVRVTYDADIGAGNAQADFYVSDDGAAWTNVGTVVDAQAPADQGSPTNSEISVYCEGAVTVLDAVWRDDIGGAVIAQPDFNAQPAGTSAWSDAQGNAWTADVEGGLCGDG